MTGSGAVRGGEDEAMFPTGVTGRDPAGAPARHLRFVLPAAIDAVGLGWALDGAPVPGGGEPAADVPTGADARAARELLGMPQAQRAVVVLVDGLGWHNLAERAGHAPFLRRLMQGASAGPASPAGMGGTGGTGGTEGTGGTGGTANPAPVRTCAPSTTAAAITAFGTGALPGASGMVGYEIADPRSGAITSLLSFEGSSLDPRSVQRVPTLAQRLAGAAGDGALLSVAPARFAGSGLTGAALRGWPATPAESLADRVSATLRELRNRPGLRLVYLYWDGVDHVGHGSGWESDDWVAALEDLDAELTRLARGLAALPGDTLLTVTADHGMVDVQRRHDLARTPALARDVRVLVGDQRAPQLRLAEPGHRAPAEVAARVADRWRTHLAEHGAPGALVLTHAQLAADAGRRSPLGPLGAVADALVGDVVAFLGGSDIVVDARTQPAHALRLVGVHGGLSAREIEVPALSTLA